jgi:hypothetical protein
MILFLLYFLLVICCFGLVRSLATMVIERDHKKGRHWNHPQYDTCDLCKEEKEKADGIK